MNLELCSRKYYPYGNYSLANRSSQKIGADAQFWIVCIGFVGMLTFSEKSHSEVWQITPTVTVKEQYNDNFQLSSKSADAVLETLLSGVLGFRRFTETNQTEGQLYANFSSHTQNDVFSNNNLQDFTFSSRQKEELVTWGLNGLYRRDTTLRTIETTLNVNNIGSEVLGDVDTGLVEIEVRRNTLQLNPMVSYQLSEWSNLGVTYHFSKVIYENNMLKSGLYDYDRNGISGGLNYSLNERDAISANMGLSRFSSADNVDTIANSYNVSTGYRREFSETTGGSIDIGFRYSLSKSAEQDESSDKGYVLQFSLDRKTELNRLAIIVSRDLQASGVGNLADSSQLHIEMRHKFISRLSGLLKLNAFENKWISDFPGSNTRYYLDFTSRLNWSLTRWWSLGVGYTYRQREEINSPNDAFSNAVFISLRYSKDIAIE